jgi:signal transduction histidine kinase
MKAKVSSTKQMGILNKLLTIINKHTENSGAQYIAYGIFGLLNYPLSHIMWYNLLPQKFSPLSLRIIAMALCIPLILKNYWPQNLCKYLPIYWYLTLLYTLPFFGTYMLLMNHGSRDWLMNDVLGLFLFMLLVDWTSFIVLLSLGVFFGWFCYWLADPGNISEASKSSILLAIYMYTFAIIIAGVFSRNREKLQREKLQGMQTLSATIAHELRTPLRAISSSASSIAKYLDNLIASYRIAKEQKLNVPYISGLHLKSLAPAFDSIDAEAKSASTFIDMLLVKVSQDTSKSSPLEVCSIATCIEEALHRYPFSPGEIELIRWQRNDDFQFQGNSLLIIHVIFNLFKNALYYIQAARKGDINIWVSATEQHNFLHFKDTATGITASILPYIFDRFVSHTHHGTGIGLAFCKYVMKNFDGNITCNSVEGEYTEFKLAFPKYYIDNKP